MPDNIMVTPLSKPYCSHLIYAQAGTVQTSRPCENHVTHSAKLTWSDGIITTQHGCVKHPINTALVDADQRPRRRRGEHTATLTEVQLLNSPPEEA